MYPPAEKKPAPVQRLPGKDGRFWKKQIELALETRQRYEKWWDANLKAYAPSVSQDPEHYGECINTNRDFTLVERKKADLFYQRPEVTLQPTPLMDGPILAGPPGPDGAPTPLMGQPDAQGQAQPVPMTQALSAHEEIVNEKLGPDGIDAVAMMDRVLFDVLCTAGLGCTKMGYESVTVEVEQEVQVGTEPQPGAILGLGPALPVMKKVKVPVPVHEHCFWEPFSPKAWLNPHDFRSTQFDKAPWQGYQFTLPLTPGTREKFKLPKDFEGNRTGKEKQYFDHGLPETEGDGIFTGVEIFYRSSLYRADRPHPEHLTRLVIVDGANDGEPVIEEDCPYQTLDAKGGLTPDSLIGFPIHIFALRVLSDSAYPPSDCTMIRPLANELNKFREQMVQYRDAMILRWRYNTDTLPPESLAKIVRSPIGGMIGMPGEAMDDNTIKEMPHGSFPRESFTSNDYIDTDISRTTAIDASGAGVQSQTSSSTATEQQIIAANANARLDKERGQGLKCYIKGVTKFSTILLRYLPVAQAAQIVGPQRAQVWEAWRTSKPDSALAFTAMPDSALRVDQAVDRKSAVELYTFLANEPYAAKGRAKLLEKLLRKHHIDPTGIVSPPDPPKPEPPKLALSFKGEDLVGPQAPIVIEILKQQGIEVSPEAIQQSQGMLLQQEQLMAEQKAAEAQTKHGGKLAQQESLSKHAADQTGGMQGTGAPAAMGAGGGMLQ